MSAYLILHPAYSSLLSALLANLAVGIAAYLLSGTARRHRQILIAWGIQTFTDPKPEDEEFSAKSSARDYATRGKYRVSNGR